MLPRVAPLDFEPPPALDISWRLRLAPLISNERKG
jgi:hypothetical protein